MAAEKVKLRIGSLARAVLITGQAYQDPKDALNEFISNAADEPRGRRPTALLRRRHSNSRVDDSPVGRTGRGRHS